MNIRTIIPRPAGLKPLNNSEAGSKIEIYEHDHEKIKWLEFNKGYLDGYNRALKKQLTCEERTYGAPEREDDCDSLYVCLSPIPNPPALATPQDVQTNSPCLESMMHSPEHISHTEASGTERSSSSLSSDSF